MWTLETFTAGAKTTALWNIVHTSNLFGDRIDADSYHHEFMQLENLLNGVKTQKLGSIAVIKSGTTPTDRDENLDNGVILLKTANIQDGYIDDNSFSYISDEIDERMRKTSLKDYDIMVNIVGATLDVISRTAPIPPNFPPTNITQAMALVRITSQEFLPYYVSMFLLTKYGKKQLHRLARPTGQYNINLQELQTVRVIHAPIDKQKDIHNLVLQAIDLRKVSKLLYIEAETLLLHELGLDRLDLAYQPAYEATFEDTIAAGRMDAEYFHPEKRHIIEQLAQLPGQNVYHYFDCVEEMLNPLTQNKSDAVNNYDLTDALRFFLADDVEEVMSTDLGSTKTVFKSGDVVISQLRSYLKEIALVTTPEIKKCVGSSEFIVLRPKSEIVNSELLMVYLRSTPVQSILKWCQNGSNHPRFNQQEILFLKLPDHILMDKRIKKRLTQAE